jgi:hypothetical protein
MILKLLGDKVEEFIDRDVLELAVGVKGEEPLEHLFVGVFFALVIRVLALSEALFVKLH